MVITRESQATNVDATAEEDILNQEMLVVIDDHDENVDIELRTEVAHWILDSSMYGTEKILAEALSKGDEDRAFSVNIGYLSRGTRIN